MLVPIHSMVAEMATPCPLLAHGVSCLTTTLLLYRIRSECLIFTFGASFKLLFSLPLLLTPVEFMTASSLLSASVLIACLVHLH